MTAGPPGTRGTGAHGTRSPSSRSVTRQGHRITLTHLDKVLYPETATTKADVVDYYERIAPVLLPHLARRAVTVVRAPDGVGGRTFYQQHLPSGAPSWIETVPVPARSRRQGPRAPDGPGSRGAPVPGRRRPGRDRVDHPAVDGEASLLWLVNLAAVELHVPMWCMGSRRRALRPDLLVFDLDPGEPAGLARCCAVALSVRRILAEDGVAALPKTSGSRGLQVYARRPRQGAAADPLAYARGLARRLEREQPGAVVSNMRKELRRGKVLVDWSQNQPSKTTVAPYSLRLRRRPWVSAPVTWDEVERAAGGDATPLRLLPGDVVRRVATRGDLFAPLLGHGTGRGEGGRAIR